METKILKLVKPLELEGKTITELTLREPTAGELEFAEQNGKTNNGTQIALIGQVTGLHPNVIRQLCARDYRAASEHVTSFLAGSPETGEIA